MFSSVSPDSSISSSGVQKIVLNGMVGDFQQSGVVSRMCNIRITKLILLSGNDPQNSSAASNTSASVSAATTAASTPITASSAMASATTVSGSSSSTGSSPIVSFSMHPPSSQASQPRQPPPLTLSTVTNSANSSITMTADTSAAVPTAAQEKSTDTFKFCVGMPKKTLGKAGKVLQTLCFKEGSPYVSGSPSEGMTMDVQFSIRYPHTFKDLSDVIVLELKQYSRKKRIVSSVQIYLSDILQAPLNGYIILSQKKEKALVQYAKVHIFAGSYPETVATFDDINEWESVLSGIPTDPHRITQSGNSSSSSSFIINQQLQQPMQTISSSPLASLSLTTLTHTSMAQFQQGGTDNVIIDDYIQTSKQKMKGKGPKSKGKSGDHSDNEENDYAESVEYNYTENLFGRGTRGSAAAAASLYASKLLNGAEPDSAQLQRLVDGYARVLSKRDFSGGVLLLGNSRKGFFTNKLFGVISACAAFRDAGILPIRVQSVWDSAALLRAIFECDAEEPVPLIVVGQSSCLNSVARPYLDLIAKRPLHSKPVAFYFVPLAKRSSCELASLLAASDPEYRALFCDEAWERQVVAQVASRDGSPTPALVEERILRYLHGARGEFPLAVGEATITQQRGSVTPKAYPFMESVQAYPGSKSPVCATLDYWIPPKKKGEHDQRQHVSKAQVQALALSRLPGFAVKCLGFEQKDVGQQSEMYFVLSQQTSKPGVMKMITNKLYPKKHTASALSLPAMDTDATFTFSMNPLSEENVSPKLISLLASSREFKIKRALITKLLCCVSADESESSSSSSSDSGSDGNGDTMGNSSSKGSASSRHSDGSENEGGSEYNPEGEGGDMDDKEVGDKKSGNLKVILDGNVFLNVRTLSVKSCWASGRLLSIKTFV